MLLPKDTGGSFQLPPEGNHLAVLYRIVDLGTQAVEYNGEKKTQHKLLMSWELHCEERLDDGRLFTFDKRYTYSSNERAAWRLDLESWRGKKFTEEELGRFNTNVLLGQPCLLNLVYNEGGNGKTYCNLASISRLPKGMTAPAMENKPYCFDLSAYDPKMYGQLSQGLQETIAKSPEFQAAVNKANQAYDQRMNGSESFPYDDAPLPNDMDSYVA